MKTSAPAPFYLIGAGGLGREIAATLSHPIFQNKYLIAGFIDDKQKQGTLIILTIKWFATANLLNACPCSVAFGL
jgi:hypothetical protein